MTPDILYIIGAVSGERLRAHISALEGERHGGENYLALVEKARFIEQTFSSLGLQVEREPVPFRNRLYWNILATVEGQDPAAPWLLVGAHYDAAPGSPGADDNASGMAVLLEVARIMGGRHLAQTLQFVAFTLEERQSYDVTILRGSKGFIKRARETGHRYAAALILECVGYTDRTRQSQIIPRLVTVPVPETADFLAVVADRRSRRSWPSSTTQSSSTCRNWPLYPALSLSKAISFPVQVQ